MAVHALMLATLSSKVYPMDLKVEDEKVFTKQKETELDDAQRPRSPIAITENVYLIKKKEKRRLIKNVVVLSIVFLLTFTAFNGLYQLQSSLHEELGMGVITQSVMNALFIVSCLFFPKLAIVKLGHRVTMVIAIIGYMTWMAANGYAVWWTMMTGSVVVGLAQGLLWPAQASYVRAMGRAAAVLTNKEEDVVVSRFFGLFYFIYSICGIFGAVLSSTVLQQGRVIIDSNRSFIDPGTCGAKDCPWTAADKNSTGPGSVPPEPVVVWTLVGVYLALTFVAVLLIPLGMDPISTDQANEEEKSKYEMTNLRTLLLGTFAQMRDVRQLLLIPMSMAPGFSSALLSAEFTKSYVTCSMGIWMVGWVGLPYGVTSVFMSFLSGFLSKYTGRTAILVYSFFANIGVYITLLIWYPDPHNPLIFYVISAFSGMAKAPWYPQISALYAATFPENTDAAFANFTLWMSLGSTIAFGYSNFLCTDTKIYLNMAMSVFAMMGYFGLLAYERKRRKNESNKQNGV